MATEENKSPLPSHIGGIDALEVYYGAPIELECGITIKQPTIGDIREYGEKRFWPTAVVLCSNPTSHRVALWDEGVDWNTVDDFELFWSLVCDLTKEDTSLVFGDLDFAKFRPIENDEGKLTLVYLPDPDIQIDREAYDELVSYLRIFFNIHPKTEKAKGMATKEIIIMDEKNRMKFDRLQEEREEGNTWSKSTLFTLISAVVNQPGFKYDIKECLNLTVFQFFDAVKRQAVIQNANSVSTGMYSGMVDIKKNGLEKELDWTRNLYSDYG